MRVLEQTLPWKTAMNFTTYTPRCFSQQPHYIFLPYIISPSSGILKWKSEACIQSSVASVKAYWGWHVFKEC